MEPDDIDSAGLIRESFRIDGIDAAQCRSIFLDWALKLPADVDQRAALALMLATHGAEHPDHPMTAILRAGLGETPRPARRGGRRGRR